MFTANQKEFSKNQLVDSINESCYEVLDDVLIEEDGDTYTLNQNYYQKISCTMIENIKPKEATAIINSLIGGVVPRIGVQHITVGRSEEVDAFIRALEDVEEWSKYG